MGKWRIPWPESWTKRRRMTKKLGFTLRDCVVFAALFVFSSVLCLLLRQMDPNNDTSYVAVIFFLEVFLTAFLTDGYFFGILSAVLSVLAVDYAFTAPYWKVSFVITGFPLTFIVMMFISVATCMITSRARKAASACQLAAGRISRYPHTADGHCRRHQRAVGRRGTADAAAKKRAADRCQ